MPAAAGSARGAAAPAGDFCPEHSRTSPPRREGQRPEPEYDSLAERAQAATPNLRQARRVSGVSVRLNRTDAALSRLPVPDLPPITPDELRACWEKALDQFASSQPQLAATLRFKELRIDRDNHFNIVVNSDYTSAEIKPSLIAILSILRSLSKRPLLNCSTLVEYIERESKPYTARDKYDVMSKTNPALETFRILFPEVDL